MKAMIVNTFGGPEAFEAADVSKPELKAGHVRIKVAATSVNTVDTMIRQMGPELPFSPPAPAILGMDFAGTVEAIGEGVTEYAIGDEVYGCAGGLADLAGTLAEFMVADVKLIAPKPKNLSMEEAAALPLVGITAYEGLIRAGVAAGQSVLVHGGTGGVGHLAIQIARHFGATVYSTGNGEDKLNLIQNMGATAIDYTSEAVNDYVQQHTQGKGFDIVFDTVGGANMLNSFDAAALNGHVATTVALLELDLTQAHLKGLSLHVVFMLIPMLHNHRREAHAHILKALTKLAEANELSPLIDKVYPLEQVSDAHARLASGNAVGKVIVKI